MRLGKFWTVEGMGEIVAHIPSDTVGIPNFHLIAKSISSLTFALRD